MLDTKKPSELRQELNRSYLELKRGLTSDEQLQRIEKREAEDEVVLIFSILDEQHQAIQDIEARVEGIKKWITHSHSC